MRTLLESVKVAVFLLVLGGVVALHFGCSEDEPTKPSSCGTGPFVRDSKTGVCKNAGGTGSVVDSACCD